MPDLDPPEPNPSDIVSIERREATHRAAPRECRSTAARGVSQHKQTPPAVSPACFPGDVLILGANGWTKIRELRTGDGVKSVNRAGQIEDQVVLRVDEYAPTRVLRVLLERGGSFEATAHHTVRTRSGWERVGRLNSGDALARVGCDGVVRFDLVESVRNEGRVSSVYNLVVSERYNFVVRGCVAHSFTEFRVARTLFHRMWSIPAGAVRGLAWAPCAVGSTRRALLART